MDKKLDAAMDLLREKSAAVGQLRLLAKAHVAPVLPGAIEDLAGEVGSELAAGAASAGSAQHVQRLRRAGERLGVTGYRLTRWLLGPPRRGSVNGEELLDLVGDVGWPDDVPRELSAVAAVLLREEVGRIDDRSEGEAATFEHTASWFLLGADGKLQEVLGYALTEAEMAAKVRTRLTATRT